MICTRRPRAHDEAVPWMCHLMAVHDARHRRNLLRNRPRPLHRSRPQPGARRGCSSATSRGCPTAPVRCSIRSWRSAAASRSQPEQSATIDMVTGVADSREGLPAADRASTATAIWPTACSTWPGPTARCCCASSTHRLADARLYERMATAIIYPNAQLRAEPAVLRGNRRGQSGLWGQSISGDLPIVLLRIDRPGPDRAGAPAGAGPCVLAPEGAGGGPGDLERGPAPATGRSCRTRSWA